MENKKVSIGIDLGTTYSSMAYAAIRTTTGYPEPVPQSATDTTGQRLERQFIPSLVCAYADKGQIRWAVGQEAEEAVKTYGNKAHLYRTFKLFLGTSLPPKDQGVILDGIPVETDPGDLAKKVILYMKNLAFTKNGVLEDYGVSSITVSTPALWTEDRKLYVEDLVRAIFPDVEVRSLEEPISALYHQVNAANHLLRGPEKYILVVDYGGGTCDVAVVKIKKDAERLQAESKKVADVIGRGSLERGGEIIDRIIARYLDEQAKKNGLTLNFHELLKESELMKIAFSNQIRDKNDPTATLMLEYEINHLRKKSFLIRMTEAKFSKLLDAELDRIVEPIMQALNNASDMVEKTLTYKDIKHVFLAGGTTLLPLVREKIRTIFMKQETSVGFSSPEPRFAIAYGNALHAYHNDTGAGFGLGVSLQESIWLNGLGDIGILIARKGASLPLEHSELLIWTGRKTDIEVGLYRGNNIILKNDKKISETTTLSLKKPLGIFPRLRVYVQIQESGIMNFELERVGGSPEEKISRQHRVPVRPDLDDMAERIGIYYKEELWSR